MKRFQLSNPIWEKTIDLLFDGFLEFNSFQGHQAKTLIKEFKEDGGFLALWMLKAMAPTASQITRQGYFETARLFLGLLELHLQIANGLGLLRKGEFRALSGKSRRLDRLLAGT